MIESYKVETVSEELNSYKRIEKTQIDQYHDEFEEDATGKEDVEDPYFSDPNDKLHSPRITGLTAVTILHQYIQTLPVDRFTKLAPFFEYEEVENNNQAALFAGLGFAGHGNVKAVLHMPHLTPYRWRLKLPGLSASFGREFSKKKLRKAKKLVKFYLH